MGQIILVAGNSGVGKTTLTTALCELAPFSTGLEQHAERPFQSLMAGDLHRYALANQVDYLLLRAEQEREIRAEPEPGLIDGGLDLDFYGFTRLFHQQGYLTDSEYNLCKRLYHTLRGLLGPPDLILYLTAPLPVIEQRHARRGRPLEIARREDLSRMDALIEDWIKMVSSIPIIPIDAGRDDFSRLEVMVPLINQIRSHIAISTK
jgi:deoxyadenosine/deoxycytidine kinase